MIVGHLTPGVTLAALLTAVVAYALGHTAGRDQDDR